MPILIDFYMD